MIKSNTNPLIQHLRAVSFLGTCGPLGAHVRLRLTDSQRRENIGCKHDDRGTKIPTRGEHKRRDRKERVDEKSGIDNIKVRDKDRQIDQANQSLERGNRQQHATPTAASTAVSAASAVWLRRLERP